MITFLAVGTKGKVKGPRSRACNIRHQPTNGTEGTLVKKKYSHYHIECNVSVLYALLPYFTKLCLYCAYGLSPFMGDFEHPTLLSPYTPQFHPVIMPCCMTSHELAMLQGTRELKHKCHFSALSLNGVWL